MHASHNAHFRNPTSVQNAVHFLIRLSIKRCKIGYSNNPPQFAPTRKFMQKGLEIEALCENMRLAAKNRETKRMTPLGFEPKFLG